ncbi:MAG: mechanosensitive ion channel [Betaproteobacteria bacterium]|nr:mechanosensitive ion channel [Betaproteobacteria bacterium]
MHDVFRSRSLITQIRVFRRILVVVLIVLALAIALMSFRWGRELGGSLLASAGIAGLAVGLAARPTVENLVAGVQLALTQPMRIEDVVIVENEWGWIEEITTTYVVVRIWDLRRLVLPLTYFTQTPFQNWTRQTANLMGTVFVYVDYKIPVQALRDELASIVKTIPQWDGKVCVLQVTDASNETMQLRALVSAADSSRLWDLRCAVREKLIEFIQRTWPEYLPRMRAEMSGLTVVPPPGRPLAEAAVRSRAPSGEVR